MAEARHHHYIPQYYLRGFANGSGKHCKLTVANLDTQQFFDRNPRNVGGVRDFNRIKVDGFKPDAIEEMLSKSEGEIATAIRNVVETKKFEGDDRIAILNLVALLAVRSPQNRENVRQFEEKIMKQMMDLSLATKERWEDQLKQMKEAGKPVNENLSYEDMKAFHEKGEYDIKLNNEHHIALEFKGIEAVLPTLVNRRWELYVANENEGHFVTTDRPVVITWNNPEEIPVIMRRSPGFGMGDTEVLFPITRNLLALGTFEGKDSVHDASKQFIAGANVRMIQHAFRQVYSQRKMFPYIGPDLQFHHDSHFMERFEASRQNAKK